jgi:hypothetical protein
VRQAGAVQPAPGLPRGAAAGGAGPALGPHRLLRPAPGSSLGTSASRSQFLTPQVPKTAKISKKSLQTLTNSLKSFTKKNPPENLTEHSRNEFATPKDACNPVKMTR